MHPGLIIVSNRLPVSVKKVDGKLEYYPSIGGLATGLSSYATSKRNKWIGWPGVASEEVSEKEKSEIATELRKHNCYPVFLTKKQLEEYYNGFSNSILWPLFHELDFHSEQEEAEWKAYKRVNKAFADVVLALSSEGSTIWVHDYQLLLLPSLLRSERPDDKIGFFLHIPFPPAHTFEKVPHSRELLEGLVGADLLGFHTAGYVQNFLGCCSFIGLGIVGGNELLLPDRIVRVVDFPMGIDYGKFMRATKQRATRVELTKLRAKFHGKRVILTVDRLDPTKGLVERLAAYQELLRQNKSLRRKVVMIMIAVPSRTEIEEYKTLKDRLETLVAEVNEEFGSLGWEPVDYHYTSIPFEVLSAYYQLADVAFIAPIKDGMNLVAKEYLASRSGQSGVLVLSETAGAAEELKDAVLVDPHTHSSMVQGLHDALSLPKRELKTSLRKMQKRISEFTVQEWAGSFMDNLKAPVKATTLRTRTLHSDRQHELVDSFRRSKKRLLLLDYDGVLVPLRNNPYKSIPAEKVSKLLAKLNDQPNTEVVIVSGRSKTDLNEWLGDVGVGLAAEHGAFLKHASSKRWRHAEDIDNDWQDAVSPLLELYTAKTPGSSVETKDASLVWHYRQASPYYAQKHLVILKRLLSKHAQKHKLVVRQGNMILEVRPRGATKGSAACHWVDREDPTFIMAIGDDYTDEDMFMALPDWAYTVKIGRGHTSARFRMQKPDEVIRLLEKLAK